MNDYNIALQEMITDTLKAIRENHDQKHAQLIAKRREIADKQREMIVTKIREELEKANANVTGMNEECNEVLIKIEKADLMVDGTLLPETDSLLTLLNFESYDIYYCLVLHW